MNRTALEIKNLSILFAAVFLWGIHGPAGRYLALEGVSMPFVTVTRFWVGTCFIFVYLLYTKRFRREFFSFYKSLLPIGLIGIALNSIVYHVGFRFVSATVAMLLENLAPFFVLALAYFFDGKKPLAKHFYGVLLGFLGLICVCCGWGGVNVSGTHVWIGIGLELLAGCTFGYYSWASGRFYDSNRERFALLGLDRSTLILNTLFHVFLISSIALSPIYAFSWDYPTKPAHFFWIVEMGVFQSGVAYILWNKAIHHFSSSVTCLFFFLTVFFTIVNEVLFLHFRPNFPILLGCAFILGGVAVIMVRKSNEK